MNSDTPDCRLENSYARLPGHFYARVAPAPVPTPVLLAWNGPLAAELGLEGLGGDEERLARLFGGNELPPGAEPIALAYAGHQFGRFVPQLGDGRAVLLGERVDASGRRRDIQLKGSGRTPFSRMGDGKSSLGPVIREYVVSEAMHTLGVPTTRALAAVATGERVFREEALPGGVFTRVAASHVRVGTFEYFAARGDADAVRVLADYAIDRHYPRARETDEPLRAFYRGVVEVQARLVAHWMALGFIHGVMNTDNTAVSGETLDYGPCAFMDEFHYDKVFSSIDHYGRYAYGQQGTIAQWNLARLADCLLLAGGDKAAFEEELARFPGLFEDEWLGRMARKLGFTTTEPDDADAIADLVGDWLAHLQREGLDYTLSFRELAARAGASDEPRFGEFELRWRERLARRPETADEVRALMEAENPLYIPRNHQVERAIRAAIGGDLSVFRELRAVLERPFEEQPGRSDYAAPPASDERVVRTFCGT
ncbi:protein adenylyltransferase SelO [Lentisalinibacter salinarum]|uniref:protein adenylyltransferase SelO n=1 Tax=Lentisalinibacter salinarum TaxID=2992239 RepID=UPI0038638619